MKTKKTKQNAAAVVGATPSVLGPTPLSELPFHGAARQQRRAAAERQLENADPGVRKPATLKVVNFHKVPPRTQIVEKENAEDGTEGVAIKFKERSKVEEPAGLGEISASIWAKTSMSKGGAKDPAAAPIAKAASIMAERMDLEQDEHAALMSTEGFRAYADAMVWGVRAPGEADDAPLEQNDPLQLRARLREVWRGWRKLPVETQRKWADSQLGREMATALKRAAGGVKSQYKGRSAGTAAESFGGPTKRKSKKADEWKYTALPKHKASKAAPEPEQQEEEGDEQQQQAASGKGKKDKQIQRSKKAAAAEAEAGAVQLEVAADREYDGPSDDDKIDEEYRRAEALRFSKIALLFEMRSWEDEDETQEAAAAAGVTVDELRKQRKEAAAAAEQQAAAAAAEGDGAAEAKREGAAGDAGAGSSRAAASRSKKRKATAGGTQKKPAGPKPKRSGRPSRQQQQQSDDEDEQMADVSDDDDDLAAEAALDKALADADDSDDDTAGGDDNDSSEEEEEGEQPPPAKKAKKAAIATAKPKGSNRQASKPQTKADKDAKKSKTAKPSAKKNAAPAAERAAAEPAAVKTAAGSNKRKAAVEKPAATADEAGPSAAAATAVSGGGHRRKKASDKTIVPGSRKQKGRQAAAAEEPEADDEEAGASAFAAAAAAAGSGGGRQRSKAGGKGQRQQQEEEAQQQTIDDEDDEPAVSGAGKSSGPRRGRSAGGAQAARIEYLEKSLFSNTRRSSYGRADSPGLARTVSEAREALAAEAAQPKSRLGKNKDKK